jgi:hypothetical protein
MLVEEKMIVTKVRARHVPMEVLGLQIQTEHVGEHDILSAPEISWTAFDFKSVRVCSGAVRRALASRTFMGLLLPDD